jgi:hypothetical protein
MSTEEKEELPVKILTKHEFAMEVESRVNLFDMGYLEAIVDYCKSAGIEPDEVSKLVVGSLKEKLEAEAQNNNLLPKSASLF